MSREHLYKAKRVNWKELPKEEWWVEGYYVKCRGHHYVLPVYDTDHGFDERYADWVEVDPETVCEYTGLTDKNGRKIFEGDILEIETENLTKKDGYVTVEWSKPGSCFVLCGKSYLSHFDWVYEEQREVIGNILDNPELGENQETGEEEKQNWSKTYSDEWIPCKDKLPEEKVNPVTEDFYEYQVTYQSGDVKDIRHYKFGNGHWWNDGEIMDAYVTAWRVQIETYQV